MSKTKKTLMIDPEVAEKLEDYSEKTTINQSKIVELALQEYLQDKEV